MTAKYVEQILETTREQLLDEVGNILGHLRYDDLTVRDIIALAAVLRNAYERAMAQQAPPAPVVRLHAVGGAK